MLRLSVSLVVVAATVSIASPALAEPAAIQSVQSASVAQLATAPEGGQRTRVTVDVVTPAPSEPTTSTPAPAEAHEPTPPPPTPAPRYEPTPADRYASLAADDRKSGRSLLMSGLLVGGVSYLFSSLGGALAIDRARDMTDDPNTLEDESRGADKRRGYGRALLIPGIGPALAIHRADRAMRAWAAGVAGLGQAVGAGLAIAGIHRLRRSHRYRRLSVAAFATGQRAHVSLGVRF